MTVELVYDNDCPNVAAARANLSRAFAMVGLPARWTEWEASSSSTPARLCGYGSPAVLVNGRDATGAEPVDGASCRLTGAPSPELIARALLAARARSGWRRALVVLPAAGAALVPGLTCPACWPGYAALLSALGLGFIPTAPHLLPLTAALLLVAVGALAFRAESPVPFVVGLVAAAIILLGKFVFESNPMIYAGAGLLVAVSFPSLRRRRAATCPACTPAKSARQGSTTTPAMEGR
jgi:hypothetical protein